MSDPEPNLPTSCAMAPLPDPQHHIRLVILPSGKTIEVVYFEDFGVPAATGIRRGRSDSLHVCPECSSQLVHPVSWEEAGPDHWDVEVRCPNCQWHGSGTYSQDVVDRFDIQLDDGLQALAKDLERLAHANMEDGIERFIAALGADFIVPDDF